MIYLLVTLHVGVCLFLMLTILLQAGKGGGVGAAFGAATSQQVFGGRGAGSFLERLTTVTAIIFMLTSMTLTYLGSQSDSAKLQKAAVTKRKLAEADAKKKAQDLLKSEVEKKAKESAPPAIPASTAPGDTPPAVPGAAAPAGTEAPDTESAPAPAPAKADKGPAPAKADKAPASPAPPSTGSVPAPGTPLAQ